VSAEPFDRRSGRYLSCRRPRATMKTVQIAALASLCMTRISSPLYSRAPCAAGNVAAVPQAFHSAGPPASVKPVAS
jgi:hypothetical protein